MVRKNDKWRPYDVNDAIRRAAYCRALRERVGLSRLEFAKLARVTERSAGRWEDNEGGGNCPDDMLDILENMLDIQNAAIARAVARALDLEGAGQDPGASQIGFMQNRTAVRSGGVVDDQGDIHPVKGASMPQGGAPAPASPSVKGASMPNARERACDVKARAMPIRLLYYPNQHVHDLLHAERAYYGIANATARACAQELERLGFTIEWKYADASDIGMDDILA